MTPIAQKLEWTVLNQGFIISIEIIKENYSNLYAPYINGIEK